MEVKLSEGQAKILAGLIAQKNEVDARIGIVVGTIAAGADIERYKGYQVDVEKRIVIFGAPDEPEQAA